MTKKPARSEAPTPERIRCHYEVEKELANRLRNASKEERRHLYTHLYDELFRRVPDHPLLTRKEDLACQGRHVSDRMGLLRRFLTPTTTFLETGPGDCSLSFEVANHVAKVYAVDVSEAIMNRQGRPDNVECLLSDGCSIPVAAGTADVAYSDQLMEHLHPDDAHEQLENIYKALRPRGCYICITPHRHRGPCDVSRHFDDDATGLHLKEYTVAELCGLFLQVGFSGLDAYIGGRGWYVRFPLRVVRLCEALVGVLPCWLRGRVARSTPFRAVLGVRVVGKK